MIATSTPFQGLSPSLSHLWFSFHQAPNHWPTTNRWSLHYGKELLILFTIRVVPKRTQHNYKVLKENRCCCCCSVAKFSSLWPHGLQASRLPCPPLSPGVCSSLCPLSHWCYLTISSSATRFCLPSIFPNIRVFSNELAVGKRKYKRHIFF